MAEKQRILIVDDDANIAELISLYLMKECYETMIVGDGEEALRVFPDFKPNLVLLDLMLPGMDGYQVCPVSYTHLDVYKRQHLHRGWSHLCLEAAVLQLQA